VSGMSHWSLLQKILAFVVLIPVFLFLGASRLAREERIEQERKDKLAAKPQPGKPEIAPRDFKSQAIWIAIFAGPLGLFLYLATGNSRDLVITAVGVGAYWAILALLWVQRRFKR
jgi:hypothetical protein